MIFCIVTTNVSGWEAPIGMGETPADALENSQIGANFDFHADPDLKVEFWNAERMPITAKYGLTIIPA